MPTKNNFFAHYYIFKQQAILCKSNIRWRRLQPKILSSMSHENFGSYFCYHLPNNSVYRVWFFFSKSCFKSRRMFERNRKWRIRHHCIIHRFNFHCVIRSYQQQQTYLYSHQSSHFAPMLSFQGIKE